MKSRNQQRKQRRPQGDLEWLTWREPGSSLPKHLKRVWKTTRQMWPRAKKYGLRYYFDYQFRSRCKTLEKNERHVRVYGRAFLDNKPKIREMLKRRDGDGCAYQCGNKTKWLEIDHIIPVSQGGSSNPLNLQLLCHSCHIKKTRRDEANQRSAAQKAALSEVVKRVSTSD